MIIRQAKQSDEKEILDFLMKEPEKNTFLIANVGNYGLDFEHLNVYLSLLNGDIVFVYLNFFSNLLFSGKPEYMNKEVVKDIISKHKVELILGFSDLVSLLTDEKLPSDKFLRYCGNNDFDSSGLKVYKATQDDVKDIYEFLQTIPETKNLYKDKAMIEERISKGDGTHYIIKDEKGIVAHGNTSARSKQSIMIGGVGVREDKRREGIGSSLVRFIANTYYAENRSVCSIASDLVYTQFYKEIGFEIIGDWNFYSIGGK